METIFDNSKLEKYSSYKDSGIEWFGEIPEYWKSERLASILDNTAERNRTDLPLLSITREKGVILRDMDNEEDNHNFIPDDLSNYKVLRKGQFGMNKMKAWQGSYGISEQDGIVSPAYFIFRLREDIDTRYFHLAIRSRLYVSFFGSASDGVRIGQWDLSRDRMKNIPFLIPPLPEQTAIAGFLDRKTALIDQAIDIKQKQIELLKERKQILIHKAVTRGLNPDVKMKDSGVEWIGEIPEHWEVLPGLRFFSENNRKNVGLIEERVLSLSYGRVIIKPIEKLVGLVPESFETYQIVKPNDIIIRGTDLQNDKTSLRTGLAKDLGIITSAYLNISIINGDSPEYIHYYLHALDITKILYKFGSGLRQNLSFADFKRLPVISCPKEEQSCIVNYIKNMEGKIEMSCRLKVQEIEKLKEYKATLINSAVTGKIKVCNDAK
jgi:type I restriction enzyme S subunit